MILPIWSKEKTPSTAGGRVNFNNHFGNRYVSFSEIWESTSRLSYTNTYPKDTRIYAHLLIKVQNWEKMPKE